MSFGLGISFGRLCKIQKIKTDITKSYQLKEGYNEMRGCGIYTESGIQIEDDYCIITENGISKKVSRKEGAKYVERVLRG